MNSAFPACSISSYRERLGLSTRAIHGNTLTTHLGLLLRVHVVDAIHRLDFFLVPTAIASAGVGRCGGENNVIG